MDEDMLLTDEEMAGLEFLLEHERRPSWLEVDRLVKEWDYCKLAEATPLIEKRVAQEIFEEIGRIAIFQQSDDVGSLVIDNSSYQAIKVRYGEHTNPREGRKVNIEAEIKNLKARVDRLEREVRGRPIYNLKPERIEAIGKPLKDPWIPEVDG